MLDLGAALPSRVVMSTTIDLKGKVCLVTGVTQGIGRAAALSIAKLGPKMVLVARDAKRGGEVVDEIKAAGNPNVELMVADLSSQADIRRLAAEFKARYQQLHLLVNNAGAVYTERQLSKDGIELTWALNHLGYFLLTELLLDVIKASAPARIVSVSSAAHKSGHINFDDLQGEKGYKAFGAYSQSKLANVLFTSELARRLEGSGVTANCLHPGVVGTGFGHNATGLLKFLVKLAKPLLKTPEQGAQTTIYLATSAEVAGVTGKYFANCKVASVTAEAKDAAIAKRLWEVSEQQTRAKS